MADKQATSAGPQSAGSGAPTAAQLAAVGLSAHADSPAADSPAVAPTPPIVIPPTPESSASPSGPSAAEEKKVEATNVDTKLTSHSAKDATQVWPHSTHRRSARVINAQQETFAATLLHDPPSEQAEDARRALTFARSQRRQVSHTATFGCCSLCSMSLTSISAVCISSVRSHHQASDAGSMKDAATLQRQKTDAMDTDTSTVYGMCKRVLHRATCVDISKLLTCVVVSVLFRWPRCPLRLRLNR